MTELTRDELERAMETFSDWPKPAGRELLELEPNERDLISLLAGELGAVPVDADGWPIQDQRSEPR